MAAPLRPVGCVMALAVMLAPWIAVARTAVHLLLDAHHHEGTSVAHDDLHDAATVLHGHGHDHETTAHTHTGTTALAPRQTPVPSVTVHPSVTASAFAIHAADGAVLDLLDPSPPLRVPIVLRI